MVGNIPPRGASCLLPGKVGEGCSIHLVRRITGRPTVEATRFFTDYVASDGAEPETFPVFPRG
jgi:hypothetical protein